MRLVPLVLTCAVAAAAAQQDAPRPRPVRIGAVVTDAAGRPLADLKPSDFVLRSGGVVQAIDKVEFRTPAADEPGRAFALFLDEFHVTAGPASDRVRRTVRQFMDAHVRAADRVVVMKPLDSQLEIALTRDAAVWRRAIETFEGRAGDYTPRTPFEEQYIGRAPPIVETSRAQIVTSALRALVTHLGEASAARSAVAFVSEGFAAGGRSDRERRLPDFQSIVRVATRANVAVYALSPSAVVPPGEADGVAERMKSLAAETGGEMAAGTEMAAALARMSRDLDTYYVLTFTPSEPGEGRFHRFELTSKRRNAVVRASSGFWTPVSPAAVARYEAPRPMRTLRRSALIQSWYGLSRLADGRMRLRVTWEPAPRKPLPGRREPNAVVVRAAKAGGAALFEGKVGAAELAEVVVPAGRVELDLTIVAADGTELDRETRDVDVPAADAPRASVLAPEIIRARTLREFQAATRNPAAAPTPSRAFRRSDRLIVRAAAHQAEASLPTVTARLLNRWGQPMRDLEIIDGPGSGVVQFALPLAWLVPGEYEIELRTAQPGGAASLKIPVKVMG